MRMLEKYKIFPDSEELQKFDVTPSSKWFLSENEQEEYDINEDFHHLTPPYPLMWMEFEHPGRFILALWGVGMWSLIAWACCCKPSS